jgi:chaperonin cofactor prefoldin
MKLNKDEIIRTRYVLEKDIEKLRKDVEFLNNHSEKDKTKYNLGKDIDFAKSRIEILNKVISKLNEEFMKL